jgi:membrane protein YqaA with SNARE-associated domain
MGAMDSSFLFLPFGNDFLLVALVARHHAGYLIYVLSAVCGSTLGIFFLDLVARKAGEEGIRKVAGARRFAYLRKKIEHHGGKAIAVSCLAPPPFPFTMLIATVSALSYPRRRLLAIAAGARALRFLLLGYLALQIGDAIISFTHSDWFRWVVGTFAVACVIGSIFSILSWIRGRPVRGAQAPA